MAFSSILVTQSNGMQLVNENSLNSYLRMMLEEFWKNPTEGEFLNIINPPLNGAMKSDFFMPKIFTSAVLSHGNLHRKQEQRTESQGSYLISLGTFFLCNASTFAK